MDQFIVQVVFPKLITKEFIIQIPEQRLFVKDLMKAGIILSYSLAADRAKLWIVVSASDEGEVMDVLVQMPLYGFMRYEIMPLAFYNSVSVGLPVVSLN